MTFRLYDDLQDSIENDFTFSLEEVQVVKGFYPYLYMKNAPVGVFKFEVSRGESVIFSKNFTSEDIKNALKTEDNNAYVFHPMLPSPFLLMDRGTYKAMVSVVSGYTPNENSHMGWIRLHNFPVNDIDYVPQSDSEIPFAMKIKTIQKAMYV